MKIIEVRDGFIKFEADSSIYLSSFIQINGSDKSYVAQVLQMRKIGEVLLANAKMLFTIYNGQLCSYDKTEPTKDAEICGYTSEILKNSISTQAPVIVGKTLDNSDNIVIDYSAFNKKMLISVDDNNMENVLIHNLSEQFKNLNKKTVIIDTLGGIQPPKYVAGADIKLPLNASTLEFMYNSCLNDATEESKATIIEIFHELSEYSKTVPFLSFTSLKSIVDDMVDNQHIFKLLVLKNKLAKLEKQGYFAKDKKEVDNLSEIMKTSDSIVLDLSRVDRLFQNYYLEFLYSSFKEENLQIILVLSNTVSKKNLKNAITNLGLATAFIAHSKYQYLNDIKDMFDNFIIEPSISNNETFKAYAPFLKSMQKDMYLTVGESTNYIPLVSYLQQIDDKIPCNIESGAENSDEADENKIEEGVSEEVSLSEEQDVAVPQPQNDIIANIDEKSESVINSISENLEDVQEVDLFTEDADEGDTENLDEYNDIEEHKQEESEEIQKDLEPENDNIIEPEYVELSDESKSDDEDINITNINEEEQFPIESSEEETLEGEDFVPEYEDDEQQIYNLEGTAIEEADAIDSQGEDIIIQSEAGQENDVPELNDEFDEVGSSFEQSEELVDDNAVLTEESLLESDSIAEEQEELTTIQLEESDELLLQDDEQAIEQENSYQHNAAVADMLENEPSIIPIEENYDSSFDEIAELDADDADENDIIVDMEDEPDNINIDEDIDQQIIEDVNKVYTTIKEPDTLEEISDSDLDLIDELNSDEEVLSELPDGGELQEESTTGGDILDAPSEGIIPQKKSENSEILEKRDSNTPIVPVYDAEIPAEDVVVSDPIQQGDAVVHAKYGNGVVEKMIKYGTKMLFSINFENIGRRLLDPTLTEIKKL